MIASFSRALLEGLSGKQSKEQLNAQLKPRSRRSSKPQRTSRPVADRTSDRSPMTGQPSQRAKPVSRHMLAGVRTECEDAAFYVSGAIRTPNPSIWVAPLDPDPVTTKGTLINRYLARESGRSVAHMERYGSDLVRIWCGFGADWMRTDRDQHLGSESRLVTTRSCRRCSRRARAKR